MDWILVLWVSPVSPVGAAAEPFPPLLQTIKELMKKKKRTCFLQLFEPHVMERVTLLRRWGINPEKHPRAWIVCGTRSLRIAALEWNVRGSPEDAQEPVYKENAASLRECGAQGCHYSSLRFPSRQATLSWRYFHRGSFLGSANVQQVSGGIGGTTWRWSPLCED